MIGELSRFAGGFLLQKGPMWEAISSVTIAVSAVTQTIAMFAAMYYIENVVSDDRKELEAMPKDKEVQESEEADARDFIVYQSVTDWKESLPSWMRYNLVIGVVLNSLSCYILQFNADGCFEVRRYIFRECASGLS